MSDPLLTPKETAARLRVSVRTLEEWRLDGSGPMFVRFGRHLIRYRTTAIEVFISAHESARRDT